MTNKLKDVVVIKDGVKYTYCAPRTPRKLQKTFPIDKSKYTVWTQGVTQYRHGTRGVLGTVDQI